MKKWLARIFNGRVGGHLLFWSWNAIFIAVVCFGLVPTGLWALLREAADGFVPASFVAAALLIIFIPIATTTLGLVLFRSEPKKLVELFYGFEAPLFVLTLARLFLVRQLTPALGFVLLLLGIACAIYLHGISRREAPTNPVLHHLRYAGQIVGLGCAIYLGSLLAFYALPAGLALLKWAFTGSLFRDLFRALAYRERGLLSLLLEVGGFLLGVYSLTLFVAVPFAFIVLHAKRFKAGHAEFAARFNPARATAAALLLLLGMGGTLHLLNRQPQERAFALLASAPRSDAERRALLDESATIRAGLVNAYLLQYRYLGGEGGRGLIQSIYQEVFKLTSAHAEAAQLIYDLFAAPVLYEGEFRRGGDQDKAARLYERFFDEPIQKGEKDTILSALEATYETSAREAGLLDTGGRKVHLDAQEVTLSEKDGFAEVEVHEVYANQTQEEQEIFYYFSLPPTAVVTGLWLGDDDRRATRFAYSVSPRGAAQKVYQRQVARRVDPALLEQVGPRQYRLRAFPVPPRGARWAKSEHRQLANEGVKTLHLWFTYQVLAEGQSWPLPSLSEKRNVYWDGKTRRTVNGARRDSREDRWLPETLKVQNPVRPRLHVISFPGGETVRMEPFDEAGLAPPPLPGPTSGKSYAIVLDRSHSMARHAREVNETLAWLAAFIFKKNDADLYLTSSAARGEGASRIDDPSAFDAAHIIYFGGQSSGDLLRQFEALRAEKKYAAVIVLTDAGSLDLATDEPVPLDRDEKAGSSPLWMVHLGGTLPAGYDDATLAAIQKSGGGATTRIEDVFAHLTLAEQNPGFIDRGGSYLFRAVPFALGASGASGASAAAVAPGAPSPVAGDDPLAAFAARAWVAAQVKVIKSAKSPIDLDRLHAMAKAHHFVSPYSSMIVLVNDEQRAALKKAENESDRFDREVESGTKTLQGGGFPGSFGDLNGTPEPGEWALFGVALIGMMYAWKQRRERLYRA